MNADRGDRDLRRLGDILGSIGKIRRWKATQEQHDMYRSAVLRELGIIGEAANHLSDGFTSAHPEVPWRSVVGLRNALVHEYWDTHWPLIEAIVDNDLPGLERAARRGIEELSGPRS